MSQALKSVKFDFTEEKVTALLKEVLTGYQESIKDKPEADMDKMQAALKQYLTSKEMNERLCKDLQELVKNNVNVDMSSEKLDRSGCGADEPVSGSMPRQMVSPRQMWPAFLPFLSRGNPAADQRGSRESG